MLAKLINPDHQGEIRLLLYNSSKENCIWNTYRNVPGDALGHFVLFPCSNINVKLQQPSLGRTANGPDPSGLKVWVVSPGKLTEVLVEGKGNIKWVSRKTVQNTSYDHLTSNRNFNCNFHDYFLLFCHEYVIYIYIIIHMYTKYIYI